MRLLIVHPFYIGDSRHVEMLRVQSLLRDRLGRLIGGGNEILSAAVFDFVDARFAAEVDSFKQAFDFWSPAAEVHAHAGPAGKWGIRRPTNYAIDKVAGGQPDPVGLFILRVIQDTFVTDAGKLLEELRPSFEIGADKKFITADIHKWPATGHEYLCRMMRLPYTKVVDYAQGALMLAPWQVWHRYYLGMPAEIHHYWDDVMMSLWLTHEGGTLRTITRASFNHMHHCDPAVAREIYQTQSAELQGELSAR